MNEIEKLVKEIEKETIEHELKRKKLRVRKIKEFEPLGPTLFNNIWPETILENVVEIRGRIGFRGMNTRDYAPDGPILLSVGNIGVDNKLNLDKTTHIKRKAFEDSPEIIVEENDVLLSKSGTIGRTCVVKNLKHEITINAAINIFRCGKLLNPNFLYFWILSPQIQETLLHYAQGTAQKNLFQKELRRLKIPIPPLNEQRRIVEKIEEFFLLIDFNLIRLDGVVKDIISLEKSVLNSAFSGKLTEVWRKNNKNMLKLNHEKIIDIENSFYKKQKFIPIKLENLPEIPKEWHWTRMHIVCSKITDGTHFSPPNTTVGDFQYITAKNIKSWGIDLSKITYVTKQIHTEIYSRCNPEKGDVLYIKDGVTTGLSAVNELDYPFTMLSSLALLKPNKEIIDSYFLKNFLNNPITFKRMTGRMTGTAIKRIILEKIRDAEIPISSIEEQKEIIKEIDRYFSLIKNMKKPIMIEIKRLMLLKNSILKQIFEGKLVYNTSNDKFTEILPKKNKQEQQLIQKQKALRGKKNVK